MESFITSHLILKEKLGRIICLTVAMWGIAWIVAFVLECIKDGTRGACSEGDPAFRKTRVIMNAFTRYLNEVSSFGAE